MRNTMMRIGPAIARSATLPPHTYIAKVPGATFIQFPLGKSPPSRLAGAPSRSHPAQESKAQTANTTTNATTALCSRGLTAAATAAGDATAAVWATAEGPGCGGGADAARTGAPHAVQNFLPSETGRLQLAQVTRHTPFGGY